MWGHALQNAMAPRDFFRWPSKSTRSLLMDVSDTVRRRKATAAILWEEVRKAGTAPCCLFLLDRKTVTVQSGGAAAELWHYSGGSGRTERGHLRHRAATRGAPHVHALRDTHRPHAPHHKARSPGSEERQCAGGRGSEPAPTARRSEPPHDAAPPSAESLPRKQGTHFFGMRWSSRNALRGAPQFSSNVPLWCSAMLAEGARLLYNEREITFSSRAPLPPPRTGWARTQRNVDSTSSTCEASRPPALYPSALQSPP